MTVPAARADVVAVIELLLTTATLAAAVPPSETVAPGIKLLPEMVIEVPPEVGPEVGEIDDTVGAGFELPLDLGKMVPSFFDAPGAAFKNVCEDRTI